MADVLELEEAGTEPSQAVLEHRYAMFCTYASDKAFQQAVFHHGSWKNEEAI